MTLLELKNEIRKYQYFEDDRFIDVSIACAIASRLTIGNPLWLILIGPSSSGKTQVLRPISMTDRKFIHSIDDITENTFLSGAKSGKGGEAMSLLQRVGPKGLIVISDITGILSKNTESRAAILAQLRMIYDGHMTKYVGTSPRPIEWSGNLGILGGGTPAIYKKLEEVGSLGERFIYYRLHDYSAKESALIAIGRKEGNEKALHEKLAELYGDYIKEVCVGASEKELWDDMTREQNERLVSTCILAENMRARGEFDWKNESLVEIVVPAMPARTVLQLKAMSRALLAMKRHDCGKESTIEENEIKVMEWCAYSLINDQKRACMKILASIPYGTYLTTSRIGDLTGLPTATARMIMQVMSAVRVVNRSGSEAGLAWSISNKEDWETIRRIENVINNMIIEDRNITNEEKEDKELAINQTLDEWGRVGGTIQ